MPQSIETTPRVKTQRICADCLERRGSPKDAIDILTLDLAVLTFRGECSFCSKVKWVVAMADHDRKSPSHP